MAHFRPDRTAPDRPRSFPARATALLVTLLALLGTYLAATPAPAQAADGVVSQNKPVTVSSTESSAFPASAAVDGNSGTRWSSAFTATAWLQVDLGATTALDGVDISWESAYAKAFSIRLSTDGTTFTTAYTTTTGTGGQQNLPVSGSARYVRIDLAQRALPAYGYSVWEFQVLGVPAAPDRTIAAVSLVNDASGKPVLGLSPLVDGSVVDLTRLSNTRLSIQATLAQGATAGSVVFQLTGAKGTSASRTENTAPYFLCNDYVDCPLLATPDTYTLTVQAYAGADASGGTRGAPLTVHFSVSATAVAPKPLDVLYIGNSLIGTATSASGEDTPALVQHLATAAGRTVRTTEVIHFGNTLQQTYDAGEVTAALSGATTYDYIVLQEYSTLVATNPAAATSALMNTYAPAFARALKPGGKVVLFKDWALVDPSPFPTRAADVAAIDTNYAALSGGLPTANLVAPVSDTFETLIASKGTSYLIVSDGKHPDDTAIYLDAATLYGILFHESPRTLADLYLPAATAASMRDVAATAIGY
ncbi:putative secreted protein [Actinacidiphila reveromycinica]|uniref:Putative secreted protein n=1 Tax=Actinacidiphila reveromycinica TaxID=659352 RepID=A0A7U3VSR1_9ACTN|nr:discoidin domain-containing protein [Streptomyces sp. SN-593]BBB02186.1 putative secreted protein [Streptomyces sp. SN-593]